MKTNSLLSALVGTSLATIGIAGCTASGQVDNSSSKEILPVTKLITKDTILLHEYVTDIQAVRNVEIRARVSGYLDKILVDEGKEVKKGQPLFQINDAEYKSELMKAKAALTSATAEAKTDELELERVKLLVEKKVISKTELEVAKAKLAVANARIEEARSAYANAELKLSYTFIRAPFDGIIDRIPLKTGSLIDEGALLTTVSDINAVYAYFHVSENEYLQYIKTKLSGANPNSANIKLILADGTNYEQKGKIETMEGEFDESTGSIAFRAHFPNPEKILKHGSTGKVRLANDVDNALMVPQKAVFEIQDKNYVYVVDGNNKVKMKEFKPKTRFSHFYIVDSGLQAGDKVVYEGIQNIREGSQIVPEFIAMDSLLTTTHGK
ncbi:efflux RND transporter periplasmic adaptor subunit [Cytophagaceae bacterium YF14B1]|uniref:Efflux RND transporter periplasmic adaptor subunit n=1 Tax=Xanthocytophaga flava TaxID=3048013 RepID=A0AAE3QSZ3_9BACT|nr:efflux RND transporter periplasmic adaptor subunit [Xanthocytophaga flavus]MDJ1482123.1 efflux RND transporter periplasmic adaptor subunit [Xanthocytophaga flavus]